MARVICSLPYASELINGVRFVADRGEMISDEIPDHVADNFASIPGYRLVEVASEDSEPSTDSSAGASQASTGRRSKAASGEAPA